MAEEVGTLDSSQQTLTTNWLPVALSQAQLEGVPLLEPVGVLSRQIMPLPDGSIELSRLSQSEYSVCTLVCELVQPELVKQLLLAVLVGLLYRVKFLALARIKSAMAWDSSVATFR